MVHRQSNHRWLYFSFFCRAAIFSGMPNSKVTSSIKNSRFSNFHNYLNFYNRQKHLGNPIHPQMRANSTLTYSFGQLPCAPIKLLITSLTFNVIAGCLSLKLELPRYVRSSRGPRVSDELRINFHDNCSNYSLSVSKRAEWSGGRKQWTRRQFPFIPSRSAWSEFPLSDRSSLRRRFPEIFYR